MSREGQLPRCTIMYTCQLTLTHTHTHTHAAAVVSSMSAVSQCVRVCVVPGSGRQPGCGIWHRRPPPQTPPEPRCRDSSAPEPAHHEINTYTRTKATLIVSISFQLHVIEERQRRMRRHTENSPGASSSSSTSFDN